jgi:hypothetical protein
VNKTVSRKRRKPKDFSLADWRDIYNGLLDAAERHHSGPTADRYIELARKVREAKLP